MKRLIFLLLCASACYGQVPQAIKGTHGYGVPSGGAYDIGTHYIDDSTNPPTVYICSSLTLVGNQNTCVWTTVGGSGSMTWPTGSAGIPNYGGSSAWGTTYNALNTIPAAFISTLNQNTTGTAGGLTGCSTSTAGSICYWNGSAWTLLVGNTTQTNWLQETSSGVPSWTAPPGSGTVNSGTQFALGEYATAGTAIGSGPTPPSTNGIYTLTYNVNAGAAVAPSISQMVASGRSITGAATTDTVASTDFGTIVTHDQAATGTVTVTLPTATTLNNPAFWYKYCNHSPQTDTLTPTTWTIQTGSAAAGSSQTIASGSCLTVSPDKNNATQWHGDLTNAVNSASGNNLCTNNPAPGAYTPSGTANAVDCLSAGTYTLPTAVTTLANNNFVILCTSPDAIIARGSGASGLLFTGNQSGIRGCTLDDGAFTSSNPFVQVTGADDFVRGVIVQNPGTVTGSPTFEATGSATRPVFSDNVFVGTQVDSCIDLNPAGTASGTITGMLVSHNRISAFAPSSNAFCILINQVSGSAAVNTVVTDNNITITGTHGEGIGYTGQALVNNANFKGSAVHRNIVTTTVVAQRLIHLFGFWGTISNNFVDDGGHGVSGPALDLGDMYNSTVVGNSVYTGGGLEAGINLTDGSHNSITGNSVTGVGNGTDGIELTSAAGVIEYNTVESNTVSLGANATCFFLQANFASGPASWNNFTGNTCNGTNAASQLGFTLTDTSGGAANNVIANNIFDHLTGAGDVGITIGAGATNTYIGPQSFSSVSTNISDSGTNTSKASVISDTVSGTLAAGTVTLTLHVTFSSVTSAVCYASDTTAPGTAANAGLASTTTVTVKGTTTDGVTVSCNGF